MIAVDTNILVHAHQREASLHPEAQQVLRKIAESPTPWGICFHSLIEFYGVATQPRIWKNPSTPAQAFNQISAWRESSSLRVLSDTERVLAELETLVTLGKVSGAAVHAARIAATCLTHGVRELWTVDRDFSRFPQLKTRNPLCS